MTALLLALALAQPADDATKWEKEIAAIEKKHAGAKPGGIAFVGSSSIRKWDLKKSFPDWPAYNCGFGGSQIRHVTQYAERIVLPLKPEAIVFYSGDNDIGAKRKPEQVRDDFRAFVKLIHGKLPQTVIYYIPIKASVKRWEMYEQQKKANALVKDIVGKDDKLKYLDFVPLLMTDDKPDPKYFVEDGLHLSEAGYAKWNEALKKALDK